MAKINDLTGRVIRQLTVLHQADYYVQTSGRKRVQWLFECSCGNKTIVEADSLIIVDLEREIKSIFADKILDTGIEGFRTEALPLKYKAGIIDIVEILLKQGI